MSLILDKTLDILDNVIKYINFQFVKFIINQKSMKAKYNTQKNYNELFI